MVSAYVGASPRWSHAARLRLMLSNLLASCAASAQNTHIERKTPDDFNVRDARSHEGAHGGYYERRGQRRGEGAHHYRSP